MRTGSCSTTDSGSPTWSTAPTRIAAELTAAELRAGAAALADLVAQYRPRVLAILGVTA
jgi:TDG/mug DNA glycosylase family protein